MLTFLELYQTLLGFVFFKLYADAGFAYPPPLDAQMDEGAAGVGAFSLQTVMRSVQVGSSKSEPTGKKVSGKEVRQTIKSIDASTDQDMAVDSNPTQDAVADVEEEFVVHPSSTDPQASAALPTLHSLSALPQTTQTSLFSPYTFWLSRETSRPVFEFLVRSFGGRIGWPASSGGGSAFGEDDESITHVIIDRPLIEMTPEERQRRARRKYVQPQWVVDCINAGKILLEEPYAQGKTLPPHLSPFGERAGAYDPTEAVSGVAEEESEAESEEEEAVIEVEEEAEENQALRAAADVAADDAGALRAAELAAEAAGVDYDAFEKEVNKSRKKAKKVAVEDKDGEAEQDMNKMLMSNKQRKLYERIKHSQGKRNTEVRSVIFCSLLALIPLFLAN